MGTQQFVDALLTMPRNAPRNALQIAPERTGLDKAVTSRAFSLCVPASDLLQGGLVETTSGEYATGTRRVRI